ncbi:hypothetical protein [Spirosoma luteum]|uniref:hypothetical protein n=1 Tax=Spirosoma luteum TaxID=431553 RepID=UPI00035F58DB|nr:hypothetical protein [Spirosoma luteum]
MTNFLAFHKTGAEPFRCLVFQTEPTITVVEPVRYTLADSPATQLRRATAPELLPYRAEYVAKSGISDAAIIRFQVEPGGNFSALIDPTQTNVGTCIGGRVEFFCGLLTDNFNIHQLNNAY